MFGSFARQQIRDKVIFVLNEKLMCTYVQKFMCTYVHNEKPTYFRNPRYVHECFSFYAAALCLFAQNYVRKNSAKILLQFIFFKSRASDLLDKRAIIALDLSTCTP